MAETSSRRIGALAATPRMRIDEQNQAAFVAGVTPLACYDFEGSELPRDKTGTYALIQGPSMFSGVPPTTFPLESVGLTDFTHYLTFGCNHSLVTAYVKFFSINSWGGPGYSNPQGGQLLAVFPVPAGSTFNFDFRYYFGLGYGLRIAAFDAASWNLNAAAGGGWSDPDFPMPAPLAAITFTTIVGYEYHV